MCEREREREYPFVKWILSLYFSIFSILPFLIDESIYLHDCVINSYIIPVIIIILNVIV